MLKKDGDRLVIVSARRTPIGAFQGALSGLSAPELGAAALKAALEDARLHDALDEVDEVLMGCVLQAGVGQNPARQAAHKSGLPWSVGATTINKVCGSGMKAIMLGCDLLRGHPQSCVAVGGMESMSNAPYLLKKARSGYRFGHGQIIDGMAWDGLEDAYDQGRPMGFYAENTAERFGFSREAQDSYTIQTTKKALKAIEEGAFQAEITALATKAGDICQDETPLKVKIEKIPSLKAAFREGGTVTAASASSISDGAAALVIMTESEAHKRHLPVRAVIAGYTTHSQEPQWFTHAPVGAIQSLLHMLSWDQHSVDLFEINEAFAVVAMTAIQELKLAPEKVNVHGGACALGHPIGASGSRLVVTLLHALERHNLKRGIASLCIGGGEATALAIERP